MPPSDQQIDWISLFAVASAERLTGIIDVRKIWIEGWDLVVVSDGRPSFRSGLFGVKIPLPGSDDGPHWGTTAETSPENWAKVAVFTQLMEPYEAIEDEKIVLS